MELKRISIDTSKSRFTLHGVDAKERAVLRRDVGRAGLVKFFEALPASEVYLEACGASHHWGRSLQGMGHRVRLIPPQYVKPYVKRGKNDRADAEAICEAASRPGMRFVPVRPLAAQARAMVLRVRDLLVKQRTQTINALRMHAAEFGLVAARGTARVADLVERVIHDPAVPEEARPAFALLAETLRGVDEQLTALDRKLVSAAKADAQARRLMTAPGIGPLTALTLSLEVDAARFESGRHFAAWLGLVAKQHSTAGRQRLGGISRQGNERLRRLLVVGATAVIRHVKPGKPGVSAWLLGLLARRPRKLVAVALANKLARIVWAMMARGEAYRQQPMPV